MINLETEPIFSIHISFADGSNPVVYYNLNLEQACRVLIEWSEEWILSPAGNIKLDDSIWYWHARERNHDIQEAIHDDSREYESSADSALFEDDP